MYKTKKEVDAHVRTALAKVRNESERNLRSFTIAKLYFKVNEFATAEQYLCSYLSVKEDNDQGHKLLGQCYQRLKKPDKALQSFQRSLQLNSKQPDVLAAVCELLLEDKNLNSNKAKYWCELAESEKVQHDAVFSLRLKLMNKDNMGTNQVEALIQKEISARPNDVQLRVRLVRNYVEKNQILDAFKYVHQLEMGQNDEFVNSSEWYNVVWLVLNKYEQMPNTKKDWDFWLLLAICLERQVQISFSLTSNSNIVGGGVTETANLLFNLDQYLFKISQLSEKLCAQKELVELFLEHYRGQLLLHASSLIFKRELLQNKNKWKETVRAVLPLLILAYQVEAPDNKEPWMKHCDEQGKQLIALWQREGSFRCAQVGRTLLSCINDESAGDKENTHSINTLLGNQSSNLWNSSDDLLSQVRQTCSDRQWRHNIFALLFCNSDQKVKEQSSLFAKNPKLSEPCYELPSYADVERYEDAAQYLRPQSLQHMVYLCLGNDNLAYVKAKYFSGLNYSTQNLSFCGAESLNQLDVDSFLYAATIQAKRALEVEREAFDNYQSGNSTAAGKPKILPFVNLQSQLCSEEQSQWWNAAYMVYKNLSNGNDLAELRANLQYGIEAVRGINGPKLDMAIVFKLGQLFVARALDIVKPIEKAFLEARAESIYKYGLNMMKMHNKGVLEPFRKYFKYAKSQSSAAERELVSAAEDSVSYLATRYFKKSEYEDLIEELSGIQLPFATYLQAEAYRKLDEASKTPKQTKRMYLDRASECLNQTLALLKSSAHADPNHPLNSVIHSEIKRLQQASARYLNDSNSNYSPITGGVHNNSSTYEDAEADFYADNSNLPTSAVLNSTRSRRDTLATNALLSSHNQEMENLVKQMCSTLTMLKDEIMETLKPELHNVTKEIAAIKDKISNLEDAMKKVRISSNPPSRDDASNVLEDLYIIEESLQQQLYQQPQTSTAAHMNHANQYGNGPGNMMANSPFMAQQQQQQRMQQAAAYNSPMFPPNPNYPPMNYCVYPNQGNPYMMTPQPGAPPALNQRSGALPSLPYLDPTVPPGSLNFNMGTTSTPLLPPPPAQSQQTTNMGLDSTRTSNLFNLLQQPPVTLTPSLGNTAPAPFPAFSTTPLTHNSMVMPAQPNTNITPTTAMQFHKTLNNNQPVEKGPPANVVITSSDPLPNPNTIAMQSQQQTPLSVTIPSHHIKTSLVSHQQQQQQQQQQSDSTIIPPLASKIVTSTSTSSSNTFGCTSTISATTFSFKPQIQAAAQSSSNSDNPNKTSDSIGSDFNRSGTEDIEYDPRPDFKPIIPLPDEIEVRTGEEDEDVMFCHRAKLFRYIEKEWKERGIGDIKILKNKEGTSRILMRRDQTHKICANHAVTPELILTIPKNETKGFIWAANDFADESLHLEKFFVRFKLPETAKQFQDAFKQAQKEAGKKPVSATTVKKEDNSKVSTTSASNTTAPFSLSKSNVTNFVTSTPAPKNETIPQVQSVFGQPIFAAPASVPTSTTPASKSLFSGINLSTKTPTTEPAKPPATSAAASPFANFTFGKSPASTAITTTPTAAAKVVTTASPFASIFSNLSTSPFTNTPTASEAAHIIPTTVNETANDLALNKSTASDNEDEYVPTAQFNPVIPLPDLIEVNTGEENEIALFEYRAKLLRFDKEAGEWKERGLGNIKLLQDKADVNKVRLVMRREQIHKLCCNQRIYKDTSFKYAKNSQTALSWAGQDFSENELITEMLTVRFKLPDTCKKFLEAIQNAQAKMTSAGEEANSKEAEKKKAESNEIKSTTSGFGSSFKPKVGSWSCEACYISNTADQLYCVACDTPKDNTVPKKEATSNILATSGNTKFSFGFAASPAAATEAKAPTKGFGESFKPKVGSWSCEACYISNASDQLYCVACDTPKDGTVPKKEANSNILATNTNTKFSFGFGSPATTTSATSATTKSTPVFGIPASTTATTPATFKPTNTPAVKPPATEGFGDAFKPKVGSWNCQGCYLSNTGDAIYCKACDAPKDDTVPKKDANTNILALSNPSQKFSFGFGSPAAAATPADSTSKPAGGFNFGPTSVAATESAKSFTFTPPSATSTTLNSNSSSNATNTTALAGSVPLGKSTFSFSLSSTAMESPAMPGAGGEATSNAFSLDKKDFSFSMKPKSPGKTGKSPLKFGGGDADGGGAADEDGGDADYHEEEENNTYFTPVIALPDKIEVKTGEENEDLLYVHRAKLYRFIEGEWKERGLGNLKILRHKENKKLRVVMRREQILKICLNHVLNEDVEYKRKDDKSWLFVVNDFSEGSVELEKFSLRFKSKEVAEEFMDSIKKALDGTAEVIEAPGNTSITTPTNTQPPPSALSISAEDKNTADALKLPYEFFTAKPTCTGCRGCDPDKFVFAENKNNDSFVNQEDIKNQIEIMELPSLTIKKSSANRSLLKQSALSPANNKAENTKINDSIFTGFGGANSTTLAANTTDKQSANTTFSFTAALNSTTKPADETKTFSSAGSGGFLFGSTATTTTTIAGGATTGGSIFGGAKDNKSIFGQKPAIFGGGSATVTSSSTTSSNDSTTSAKSIFGGSANTTTTTGSIFGGKAVFGGTPPSFGALSANDTNKSIFGSSGNTTQSAGNGTGSSIFGTSSTNTTTGFGAFSSNNTAQGSLFGSSSTALPQFGSLAKDSGNVTSSSPASTVFADLSKNSASAVDFASIAAKANTTKLSEPSANFDDLSKTSLDFASLSKANTTTPLTSLSNDKPSPGGFIGLTNQNAFSSFDKPLKELDTSDRNASLAKGNESQKSIGGGNEDNDENYDPHYEPIIELPNEVVVSTGEEEEEKLFGERAVLYRWDATNKEWKERGVGELKILLHPAKQSYRLILRREQIHKLVLNHAVSGDFHFSQMNNNPKSFVWATMNYAESNEGELEKLAVRFKKVELAEAFSEQLNDCIKNCKEHDGN